MFRIAICEDEKAQRDYLEQLITIWQNRTQNKVSVTGFVSAEQFLFETEEEQAYDLLILDIQMGEMNGVELARKVRGRDTKVKIVFLTGIIDYAIEGYEVGAVRYLLKPVKEEAFFELLNRLSKEIEAQKEDWFLFQTGGVTNRVSFSDILYVEADGHYVVLKAVCREVAGDVKEWKWKSKVSALSDELEAKGFFLLRRGLYVNLAKVEQIGRNECGLENGEVLPVSKSRYQALNEAFIAYYKGMTD